jgi:hypothetical protein
MNTTARIFVPLTLIVFTTATCLYSAPEGSWLRRHVCRFVFHGANSEGSTHNPSLGPLGIANAARDLALHAEVPICIEELPAISVETDETSVPIEIDASDTTVKDILDGMIRQDPRYIYRERLGVIEILPDGADRDPADCLNIVIPLFEKRSTWDGLISDLRTQVAIVADSAKDGAVRGGSVLAHPPPGLIEASFKNRTLRDILSMLCAKVGNMGWSAHFEGPSPTCEDISFGVYQPKMWYPLNTVPLTYSEGLPKNCTSCHYHKPCRTR